MSKIIEKKYLQRSMDYESYRQLIDQLLLQGKTTGEKQSEQLIAYARLNVTRMNMIDETFEADPDVSRVINAVGEPQTWIVLTEGWCRDAAQIVPVLHGLAKLNNKIKLRLLLRDENLELMDQYLTNSKSRSIPKLIAVNSSQMKELFNWGASPAIQQAISDEKLRLIQKEIGHLVARHIREEAFV